jgi:hypothetical protein
MNHDRDGRFWARELTTLRRRLRAGCLAATHGSLIAIPSSFAASLTRSIEEL